jgi:hypothetical protein
MVGTNFYLFLISAPDGGEWSTSHFGSFTPGKDHRFPVEEAELASQSVWTLYITLTTKPFYCTSSSPNKRYYTLHRFKPPTLNVPKKPNKKGYLSIT